MTTVLTVTLTGFAADLWSAGGRHPSQKRRLTSVVAMLGGASIGGVLVVHAHVAAALGVAFALLAAVGVSIGRASTGAPKPWAAPR